MSVVIQDGFTGIDEPIDHPRICYEAASGTMAAFQTVSGADPAWLNDGETWSVWQGSATNSSFTLTFPSTRTISYAALAAHDLGSQNSSITLLGSTDGSNFSPISGFTAHNPEDDSVIVWLFAETSLRAIRWQLGGGTAPKSVAVAQAGGVLEMPRLSVFTGLPISESKQVRYRHQQSITGDVLGRAVEGADLAFDLTVNNLPETFRSSSASISWANFLRHVDNVGPFFIAAKPSSYPDDVAYARATDRPRFERQTPNALLSGSITFPCLGYAAP